MITSQEIINLLATGIVAIGGAGAIILKFSSYFGKVWADRGLEKLKANYTKELEAIKANNTKELESIKSSFLNSTERYKIQLKKSESFFQKQYDAGKDFADFYHMLLPKKDYPDMDWGDAIDYILKNIDLHIDFLRNFISNNAILFEEEVINLIESCQNTAVKCNDEIMEELMFMNKNLNNLNQIGNTIKIHEYGTHFHESAKQAYIGIKKAITEQVKY